MSSLPHPDAQAPEPRIDISLEENLDAREQLVNGGEVGPIGRVSIPIDMITRLKGIMLDFDPNLYDPAKLPRGATESPRQLFESFVGPMLARHPVYARAEVRDTGRGLHAILWLETPIALQTTAERERWAAIVKIVQKALPTDPGCAGITAMTRPLGSTNSKTGRKVSVLKAGTPVTAADLQNLVADIRAKPFKVVAGLLLDPVAPSCPMCAKTEARMGVMDKFGTCYGGKHRPKVGDLFAAVFATHPTEKGA